MGGKEDSTVGQAWHRRASGEGVAGPVRMAAAVKLFEMRKLSSGAAAALAGIARVAFLSKLADYGVETFDITEDEFARETRLA